MVSLPDSLIFEFLIRVPVKSLARFKCLNKFWRSLISHPDFIYTQLETAKTLNSSHSCLILSCLLHDDDLTNGSTVHFYTIKDHDKPAVIEFSSQVTYDSYNFLPSCNGLVCFYGAHAGIYVCNPSMKNVVRIPDSIAPDSRLLSCGFGFDQHTRSYKTIRIIEPFRSEKIRNAAAAASGDDDGVQMEVLTMGTSSWRAVKINGRFRFPNRQPPVYANGFFYWISACNSSGFFLQSFDIGSENLGIIHVPEKVSRKNWRLFSLEELGGEICLVDLDFEMEGKKRMDLWLFKRVVVSGSDEQNKAAASWVQETILHPSEPLDAARPVAFHDREILLQGFIRGLNHLNWYDLKTGRFRGADSCAILSPYFHVRSYVESLVSLQL